MAKHMVVAHSVISIPGRDLNAGEIVTEQDVAAAGEGAWKRLQDVGALRKPTEEEEAAQALIAERETVQERASADAGRSEIETAGDVASQRERGDVLIDAAPAPVAGTILPSTGPRGGGRGR